MALWMVRAGREGHDEDIALEKGMVVLGCKEFQDLSEVTSREQLEQLYRRAHPDESQYKVGNHVGQIWAFRELIQPGDLVVLPLKTRAAIAVGEVTGPYKYVPSSPETARHTRPVKWIRRDIPRSVFDRDLLYSMGALLTVCRIERNNAEERIRAMLKGKPQPPPSDGEEEGPPDPEQQARDSILAHIGQRFQRHELARLVTAILKVQGYQAQPSPPGPDGGVDVVAGRGPMGFDPPKLCVQVKSGASPVDVKVLRELHGVMKDFGAEQGLLVSWSGFRQSVYRDARRSFFTIRLWDSGRLLDAVLEHYEHLPEEIRAELPLKRIWTLLPEEST